MEAGTDLTVENFTMIPDSLLLAPYTTPIFVIRNPRMAVPSAFRVLKNMGISDGGGRSMALVTTCNVWSRVLYDYYIERNVIPLVLDADDYLCNHDFVRRICELLGLDSDKARFSWPAITEEEKDKLHPMEFFSAEELFVSTGPDASRTLENMERELELHKQREEFGDSAKLISELIAYAMPHYEYLWERRVRL